MKKWIACVALASLSALAWALPTLQQVEAEVRQGNFARAESMMREVVAARPTAPARITCTPEILAHDGKLAQAVEEARAARTIDPDVKFTDPEKFRTFEAALLRAQNPALGSPRTPSADARTPAQVAPTDVQRAPATTGVPGWAWLAALAAIGFVLWRMVSRRRAAATMAGAAAASVPRWRRRRTARVARRRRALRSRRAGRPRRAVRSGLPAAAAGQRHARRRPRRGGRPRGRHARRATAELASRRRPRCIDAAGVFDAPQGGSAASDLDDRPIDFGTGGNDWDAGSSDVGGGDGRGDGGGWD
jgi:hypothetical protein